VKKILINFFANAHSQAQWQVTQAYATPKPAIELVCLPTLPLPILKKLNFLKTDKGKICIFRKYFVNKDKFVND